MFNYIFERSKQPKPNRMKRNIIAAIILIMFALNISAQQRDNFSLDIKETHPIVQNSLYNTISFMDSRLNRTRDQYIVNAELFSWQLSSFVNMITDRTAKNGTMLFQLRNLSFETEGDKGFSHIRATLYESLNSQFYMIATLDTEIQVANGKNISPRLQEEISSTITSFIADNLTQPYTDNIPYTLDDIRHIDTIEKESSELYKDQGYRDGIYYTFDSFKNQKPIVTKMEVRFKKEKLSEIKIIDRSNNKFRKVNPSDIYAVVLDGQIYIALDKKYYTVYPDKGNLLFDAEYNSSNVGFAPSFSVGIGSGGYRGGGIGLGVFTKTKKETVTYMIDHMNGRFIKIN